MTQSFEGEFEYCTITVPDTETACLLVFLRECFEFIEDAKGSGGKMASSAPVPNLHGDFCTRRSSSACQDDQLSCCCCLDDCLACPTGSAAHASHDPYLECAEI